LPAVLRGALLLLLAAALLIGERTLTDEGDGVHVVEGDWYGWSDDTGGPVPEWAEQWTSDRGFRMVLRRSNEPPERRELAALEVLGRAAPILALRPTQTSMLRTEPPTLPRVGRASSIGFVWAGPPGDTITLRLLEGVGVVDSLRFASGADGRAEGAFRVRPVRPGWHEWRVEGSGLIREVGAWVTDAPAPRLLVVGGAPTWESRFVSRSLEEAGVEVDMMLPLGRGLAPEGVLVTLPADADRLASYDGVVLLPTAEIGPAQRAALRRFAVEHGGGVLVMADDQSWSALQLADSAGPLREGSGVEVNWRMPAELVPLPQVDVAVGTIPVRGLRAGVVPAAERNGDVLLALRPLGRGRAAALGLTDTWRWRMVAGRTTEHREFWGSLAEWLSGGIRDESLVRVERSTGATESVVGVEMFAPAREDSPEVTLYRPDGGEEILSAVEVPDRTGVWRAAFLAADPGLHRLALADAEPTAAFRAGDENHAPESWARLSLLAHRSGGGIMDALELDCAVTAAELDEPERTPWLPFVLLGMILSAATVEWTIRRLSGRA